jgi:hypothetical protein
MNALVKFLLLVPQVNHQEELYMTGILTEFQPEPVQELRLLTAEEIDLVTGGKGGALAAVLANVFAGGSSTFAQATTRTYAFHIGNVSIAFGFGFGIAIGIGSGSAAQVAIGASASAGA